MKTQVSITIKSLSLTNESLGVTGATSDAGWGGWFAKNVPRALDAESWFTSTGPKTHGFTYTLW